MKNTIELLPTEVVPLVIDYLEARASEIDQRKEQYIAGRMKHTRWQKFFRIKPLTRNQAIEALESDMWSGYNMANIRGKYWSQQAESIKSAALQYPDKPIHVDVNLVRVMRSFIGEGDV